MFNQAEPEVVTAPEWVVAPEPDPEPEWVVGPEPEPEHEEEHGCGCGSSKGEAGDDWDF